MFIKRPEGKEMQLLIAHQFFHCLSNVIKEKVHFIDDTINRS